MLSSLRNLPIGQSALLERLDGESLLVERLMDLGFHPGVELEVIRQMPLGGPMIIRVEVSFLALREEEAQCLIIK